MIRREEDGDWQLCFFSVCTSATPVITQREWNYLGAQLLCFCPLRFSGPLQGDFDLWGFLPLRKIGNASETSFRVNL